MHDTAHTLAQWLEQEAALRTIMQPHGVAALSEVLPRTGLQLMQGILTGEIQPAPLAQTLDFLLVEASEGRAVFQGTPSAAFLNPMGTVHGGWFATLLDSAVGCAVHTQMPAGRSYTVAQLSVNMVKAITPKVQRVRAIGEVIHCGRQLASAQARLVGPDGTLYGHATATCLIFDIPKDIKP
jgi:uncharacterized protein (TIGR00369 family)